MRAVAGLALEGHRGERDSQAVAGGGSADHDARRRNGVDRGDGSVRREGYLELIVAVLGVDLLDG